MQRQWQSIPDQKKKANLFKESKVSRNKQKHKKRKEILAEWLEKKWK